MPRQLRLLLWKDYLIRKRKLITLGGVIWATAIVFSLYIVRTNVDNVDYKTCQYAARALPSAGVLNFLQSFICSVNNECLPMEQYEQIPTYENSTLTKLQRQFTPLLYNDSVLNVAATVPDALKLLATLADIVDEPTFVSITKNGLKVRDLFHNPVRVRRYIASKFNVSPDVAESIMGSELSFQGIMKGNIDRCSTNAVSETLKMDNAEHLSIIVEKLCSLTTKDIRQILLDVIVEINFGKYINMIGDMYKKLSGDDRLSQLGYMLTAVLRMTNANSFLPPELTILFGQEDFSYFNLTFVSKLMDQFKPTFGDTEAYKSMREVVDAAVVGVQYLNKFMTNQNSNNTVEDISSLLLTHVGNKLGDPKDFKLVSDELSNAVQVFDATANNSNFDGFIVLSKLANLIFKWVPDSKKHDVLFYSTLLTKLIEGAHKVVSINMRIEEVAYNASLRNSDAFKLLLEIPAPIVVKGLEALADAERAQIFTSKINFPGQLFCDKLKLQRFFVVSNTDAEMLKSKLCRDAWKNYVSDLIRSFGFFDVKNNINNMASLLIQETVGKDTSGQLYTLDQDFQVLRDFYYTLIKINEENQPKIDWTTLINDTKNGYLLEVFEKKTSLRNHILITLHGALAKEIIKQNTILDFKITPVLIDAATMVTAINAQLASTPTEVTADIKNMYPDLLKTMLMTALDEEKTYTSLSTHSENILCQGVDKASLSISLSPSSDNTRLVSALCEMSRAIERGFLRNSSIGKAIEKVNNSTHGPLEEVKWTQLIDGVKQLYNTLNRDYPYFFEFKTYAMDQETQKKMGMLLEEAKNFWFGKENIKRSLHLSIKFGFRVLDLLDREIFNMTSESWLKVKRSFGMLTGPLGVAEEFIRVIAALSRNETYASDLPPTTVQVIRRLIPNLPHLIADAANIIASDNTDVEPIIAALNAEPPWPCSNSLTNLLDITNSSKEAVEALETVLCLDKSFQQEWVEYLKKKNLTNLNIQNWDTTSQQHVFLKFSSTFDSVIKDTAALQKVLEEIADDSSVISDRPMTFVASWRYALHTLEGQNAAIRNFFMKLDTVLDSVETPVEHDILPLNNLWENCLKCSRGPYIEDDCRMLFRSAGKNTLRFLSVLVKNMAEDLHTYFYEINEPNSNLLQVIGFTKKTGLYMLYDKMTDFIGVLLNSYWDYGFMTQIRRASQSQFWDCEAVVTSFVPPPGSAIDINSIRRVQPYICPSLLYWISLPRGDNTLLDIVSKPQYYFFTISVSNLTSNYVDAFDKVYNLTELIQDISNKNETVLSGEDIKLNTIKSKFDSYLKTILNYSVNKTDASYKLFSEINAIEFAATSYLARVVAMVNELHTAMGGLKIDEIGKDLPDDDIKSLQSDLTTIQKIFTRRPTEAIALHFDVITNVLWQNNENYTLTNGLIAMCDDSKNNITQKDILLDMQRTKVLLCAKKYQAIYRAVDDISKDSYETTRTSLYNFLDILQQDVLNNLTDVADFLKQRNQIVNYLKHSINYSYDLGIPIYLKYLHSIIQHQDIILTFISGGDWWKQLRDVYNGPYATKFFYIVENSFDIIDDVVTNLDQFHFVRLLRDINVNNTDVLCFPNITLSDYIPDRTGVISDLKSQLCMEEKTELFKELPLLVIASQGYNMDLKLSKEINYTSLNIDISNMESKFVMVKNGPQSPMRPKWVTEEKLAHVRVVAMKLLSQESMTKMAFGFLNNIVDASTLFLNNSQCSLCSPFTTWFKQLNLQLFKKQDYDNLLCHINEMSMEDIYQTLKNNFHWDMAIKELMSTRNYTKYELNKAVNEFLEHVELHLLEDMTNHSPKLTDCLAKNVTRNAFGNATMLAQVLAQTLKLLRTQLPHLREIDGISNTPFMKKLLVDVAHKLDVEAPLKNYLKDNNELNKELKDIGLDAININDVLVNLRTITQCKDLIKCVKSEIKDICGTINCSKIIDVINNNLNKTLVEKQLPILQTTEFWRLSFVTSIVDRVEQLLSHTARLLGVASGMDVQALLEGKLSAMLDFVMRLLTDEILDSVIYSLQSIIKELQPILKASSIEADVEFLTKGLRVMQEFKNSFLEKQDLRVEVSELFSLPDHLESALSSLGINNTNFWSIAAPRVHAGYINLKPIITPKSDYRIASFVCQTENMSQAIVPANVDVVTLDDVYGAIIEQFCNIGDEQAKQVVAALMENVNFSYVMDKMSKILLTQLYAASNLTADQGTAVLESYPQMAALLPVIQDNVGNLSDTLANEPVFRSLADFTSVGNLITSSSFLASAGNMLCGTPMRTPPNKFYKAIVETTDFSKEPDPLQLEVLPTDFCRSLYKDILNIYGGKIVWSYIKPIIMGKILYTPINPMVERIIEQANGTYAHMQKLVNLVHSFANAFSSIDKLSHHRDGITVMRRLIASPAFSQLKGSLIGDAEVPDVDVDGLFDEFGDLKNVGSMLRRGSDFLRCINMDRFRAMPDEHELTHEAVRLTRINEFSAGLVFMNVEEQSGNPINVEYKIRMDIESVPTTTRIRNQFWTPGPEDNFLENMRYFRGFVQIQDLIDNSIIQLASNSSRSVQNESKSIQKRDVASTTVKKDKWAVYTQQTPYPCYRKDYFQASLYESQALVVAFFFSLLFTVASVVRFIVTDKESGNTMLMSVMGVNLAYHTLSWFIASLVELVLTAVCVTVALTASGVLPRTDVTLLFTLLLVFGFSVLMFCYLVSKLFSSASSAAVTTALAYLVTFMPYVLILSLEALLSLPARLLACLSMSTAFSYSMLFIARYEAVGNGAHWGDLWSSEAGDGMSIALAAIMMIVDGLIYLAIGCLIDRYFGIKTIRSNITYTTTSSEKAGVSIVNVTKIYGERSRRPKVALQNVSIELHKGQITTLLGHNGAGKTTLINILTGMLKPTHGHVTVRSERARGSRLGVCPQRDVLFPSLSAREHVALYAQLKSGQPLQAVRDEINSMLHVLSLGGHAELPASKLSGGTRRRLCVALAFVGRPDLVSLDEPAAGVDPAARRDIWSMILKLKEDRTVLLTTHHLDEAEFLSDQVVIMHKGQIHTMGSPIEIKRSLGNGYKLTVTFPHNDEWGEDEDIEEKTKLVLATVRDVVRNAQVVDVDGLEVEITLPFFDADGLNNDFQKVCATLESRQSELGFSAFTMDCSSLEQVFFTITARADASQIEYGTTSSDYESPSKSASSSSIKTDRAPLVDANGELAGSAISQLRAMLWARYLHYSRNRWLLFLLLVLPSLFVTIAMGFSMIRPPADNEVALRLHPGLYNGATEFMVPQPTSYSEESDAAFAQQVLDELRYQKDTRNWIQQDSPECRCEIKQVCNITEGLDLPEMMLLPDADTLNHWLIASQEQYIEKRYGGYTAALKNNVSNLVAWYNNKGHHALPSFVNGLNAAILQSVAGDRANITTYSHPLKISKEQLSKSTLLQHVADAGISGMLLVAYSLVTAGAAVYLVSARTSQQKRLQLLSGVSPAAYWGAALAWDMMIMVINIAISVCVLEAFGFPVFVSRSNLPAICLLLLLFGYSCGSLVHLLEKLFTDPSLANMVIFCANVFLGLSGITILLIMDIISESQATDDARWVLHKVFMVSPQFILADALLEIAKNTVQAQVLERFGMDTYKDPLSSDLLVYHYTSFVLVGTVLMLLNLAIEYDYFEGLLARFRSRPMADASEELEAADVVAERRRVADAVSAAAARVVRLPTIGNINAGFIDTEGKKNSVKRMVSTTADVAQCVGLSKQYHTLGGPRAAVSRLTLGIPPGQCTALLGENGAGKSTTFAMLTGELRPSAGLIYLNDAPATPRQLCSGLISYCPQSDALDPLLTVRETLSFYCQLRGIQQEDEVIKRTVDMFELVKYTHVRTGALSGGNKRKLCAAIAFMGRTPLVLLDEPTSGMDPVSRASVSRGVRAARAARRGVLLSTHALRDARRLCARVALMRRGRLCALAGLDDCLQRFGGGYAVCCRVGARAGAARDSARAAWRRVRARMPHAVPRDISGGRMHFIIPALIDDKQEKTRLSDIFRLMAELQSECDVEDYTVNQSSLEEMFLSFSDKPPEDLYLEPLPTPQLPRRNSEQLDSITSL